MSKKRYPKQKKRNEPKEIKSEISLPRKLLQWDYTIFLLAMLILLPLFFWEGYTMIATRKYLMFSWIMRIFLLTAVPLTIVLAVKNRKRWREIRLGAGDILMLLFFAANLVTFLLTDLKGAAWTGYTGWNMGFRNVIFVTAIYFFTSRLFPEKKWVWMAMLVTSGLIFIWGSANQMGHRVVDMDFAWDNFIGPIGNTNWFAGYMSVFLPAGVTLFIMTTNKYVRILAGIYTAVAVFAVFAIKTESALIPLIVAVSAAWYFLFRFRFKDGAGKRFLRFLLPGAVVIAGILVIVLIMIHTLVPGSLSFLDSYSFFTFDKNWGTFRGLNYQAAVTTFSDLPLMGKLFGVGQDCFPYAVYDNRAAYDMLVNFYAGTILSNAHNEFLTSLVNTGLIGTILYYTAAILVVIRVLRRKAPSIFQLAAAAVIVSYLLHNLVSFAQVMNYPYLFLWMGIAERKQIEQ